MHFSTASNPLPFRTFCNFLTKLFIPRFTFRIPSDFPFLFTNINLPTRLTKTLPTNSYLLGQISLTSIYSVVHFTYHIILSSKNNNTHQEYSPPRHHRRSKTKARIFNPTSPSSSSRNSGLITTVLYSIRPRPYPTPSSPTPPFSFTFSSPHSPVNQHP